MRVMEMDRSHLCQCGSGVGVCVQYKHTIWKRADSEGFLGGFFPLLLLLFLLPSHSHRESAYYRWCYHSFIYLYYRSMDEFNGMNVGDE